MTDYKCIGRELSPKEILEARARVLKDLPEEDKDLGYKNLKHGFPKAAHAEGCLRGNEDYAVRGINWGEFC